MVELSGRQFTVKMLLGSAQKVPWQPGAMVCQRDWSRVGGLLGVGEVEGHLRVGTWERDNPENGRQKDLGQGGFQVGRLG